jgi:DNA-binding MarR family transcriptional regulator
VPQRRETLGFLIADVSRLMRRAFRQRLEESAVTFAQARVLVNIARQPGMRQVELADLLEVQPITLARVIDQLAENGLVERRPDPCDRRAYQLFPLPGAEPTLAVINEVSQAIYAIALEDMGEKQAGELFRGLQRMRDNLATRPLRPTNQGNSVS